LVATTRVYILANELGVKSSAIIKKCQDEGLDVKNHMAVLSAGLAATIREWFSEGDNVTTIETAEKVDLERVRVRPRHKKTDAGGEEEAAGEGHEAEAVEEGVEALASPVETPEDVPSVQVEAPPLQAVEEVASQPEAEQVAPPEEPTRAEPVVVVPPPKPTIMPAGPMLGKPTPAKLQGPRVVRIEAPEPVRPFRPRAKPRYDAPVTEPLMAGGGDKSERVVGKSKKPVAKKGKVAETAEEAARKPKPLKWRQRDIEERQARLDAAGGEGLRLRPSRKIATKASGLARSAKPKAVTVTEPILVKDLGAALGVKISDIIGRLMQQGIMANANQAVATDVAEMVALEFDTELTVQQRLSLEDQVREEFDHRERTSLKRRPVVVTVLGHVDHGKTSLLDRIRSTQVAAGEAGGITQHIGASQVFFGDKAITFLDTPGHEAFTAMRARGATMTDVVVLVVAADDGVMPQTVEAIAHAKAAAVPIIVALNKIDLPGWDINRVYAQLAEQGLAPVEWSGQAEVVKTSAHTGEGIQDLLEHIEYVAELLNPQTDDTVPGTGWVVEAKMSSQQGSVATVLVRDGSLKKGDCVLAGGAYGRIKTIRDSMGRTLKAATGGMPVEILGLDDVPQAGDRFYCLDDINKAKAAAEETRALSRENALAQRSQVTLDNLFTHIAAGSVKELKLIIRADVQGSVEVLKKHLTELSTDEVKIGILHAAPGGITEGDVLLAEASNAIIIGFNVVADEHAAKSADAKGVDIKYYNIIYRISEDLRKAMAGLLEPEEKENVVGRATVRATFKVSQVGTVAGSYVTQGVATRHAKVRLVRDSVVIRDSATVESLKHFKDDAREVRSGLECGIKLAGFDDIKVNDILEFYEIVKIARTLD
jgi:translation initiation factor IF-2